MESPTVWLPYKVVESDETGVILEGHESDVVKLPAIPADVMNHPDNRVFFCPGCNPPWQNDPFCRC